MRGKTCVSIKVSDMKENAQCYEGLSKEILIQNLEVKERHLGYNYRVKKKTKVNEEY